MLKIRLARVGAKHQPRYRIVVADARAPRDGSIVERLGYYNPLANPAVFVIDEEKARHWLKQGAQPTATVANFLRRQGILEKTTPE